MGRAQSRAREDDASRTVGLVLGPSAIFSIFPSFRTSVILSPVPRSANCDGPRWSASHCACRFSINYDTVTSADGARGAGPGGGVELGYRVLQCAREMEEMRCVCCVGTGAVSSSKVH